ncbi:hypothetical protein Tco_0396376 [Tanacetum coccineum]
MVVSTELQIDNEKVFKKIPDVLAQVVCLEEKAKFILSYEVKIFDFEDVGISVTSEPCHMTNLQLYHLLMLSRELCFLRLNHSIDIRPENISQDGNGNINCPYAELRDDEDHINLLLQHMS